MLDLTLPPLITIPDPLPPPTQPTIPKPPRAHLQTEPLLRRPLPTNLQPTPTPPRRLALSTKPTPARLAVSSVLKASGGYTHASLDGVLRQELDGRVHFDVLPLEAFLDMFVLPTGDGGGVERGVFEEVVGEAIKEAADVTAFRKGCGDAEFKRWVVAVVGGVQRVAVGWLGRQLELTAGEEGLRNLTLEDKSAPDARTTALTALLSRLTHTAWVTSPQNITSPTSPTSVPTRRKCDLLLSGSPLTPPSWPSTLAILEHKSDSATTPATLVLQMGDYVSAALVSQIPFRRVMHGVSVVGGAVRLWLWDRCGALVSQEVGIPVGKGDGGGETVAERLAPFVRVMMAYLVMDVQRAGWDTSFFGEVPPGDTLTTANQDPQWYITLLQSHSPKSGVLALPVYTKLQRTWFRLHSRFLCRPGIACRGTVIYTATLATGELNPPNILIKWAWRYEYLTPEGHLLEAAQRPEPIPGLVRMLAHDELGDVFGGIRRGVTPVGRGVGLGPEMAPGWGMGMSGSGGGSGGSGGGSGSEEGSGDGGEEFPHMQNRVLSRIAITPLGRQLTSPSPSGVLPGSYNRDLASMDATIALFSALHSAFQTHFTLYTTRGILHRDISINNILISPPGHPCAGILIDLDYALQVQITPHDGATKPARSGAPHRTGTLPFMALPVLNDPTVPHCYHYDVQSFLFVVLWCCMYADDDVFNPPPPPGGNHPKRAPPHDPLAHWRRGTYPSIYQHKHASLSSTPKFRALLRSGMHPWFAQFGCIKEFLHAWRRRVFFAEVVLWNGEREVMFVVDGMRAQVRGGGGGGGGGKGKGLGLEEEERLGRDVLGLWGGLLGALGGEREKLVRAAGG